MKIFRVSLDEENDVCIEYNRAHFIYIPLEAAKLIAEAIVSLERGKEVVVRFAGEWKRDSDA